MEKLPNVSQTLKWKAEVTFEGSTEEFNQLIAQIAKYNTAIKFPGFGKVPPGVGSGYAQFRYGLDFQKVQLSKLLDGVPSVEFRPIGGFAGGITTPHLHLGDKVLLCDKERFKVILGEAARIHFEDRVEMEDDYTEMIKPIIGI
jgi:hypothetical protein